MASFIERMVQPSRGLMGPRNGTSTGNFRSGRMDINARHQSMSDQGRAGHDKHPKATCQAIFAQGVLPKAACVGWWLCQGMDDKARVPSSPRASHRVQQRDQVLVLRWGSLHLRRQLWNDEERRKRHGIQTPMTGSPSLSTPFFNAHIHTPA